MIAACAMAHGDRVATRNIADFVKFEPHGLSLIQVPTLTES